MRTLYGRLDLGRKLVSINARHTQAEAARQIVLERLGKGELVTHTLVVPALDREKAGFPLVAHAARLHRKAKTTETALPISSRPKKGSPRRWQAANMAIGGSKPDFAPG